MSIQISKSQFHDIQQEVQCIAREIDYLDTAIRTENERLIRLLSRLDEIEAMLYAGYKTKRIADLGLRLVG